MNAFGIVESIDNKASTAKVRVKRQTSCGGNCAACAACDVADTIAVAQNPCGAGVGDIVELSLQSGKVLFAAFLVYILPLVVAIIGYAVFEWAGAAAFFLLSFVGLYFGKKSWEKRLTSRITRILD